MSHEDKKLTELIKITPASQSHLKIENNSICREKCLNKYCTIFCPTNVFTWSQLQQSIIIDYQKCIECLACPFGCPYQNIQWQFPTSGYGVEY